MTRPLSLERQPKIIVVTPTSLVSNWIKETKKWLGRERLQPIWVGNSAAKETKRKLEEFVSAPVQQMLVISYENVRSNLEILRRCKFHLMICDEGHRLKNIDAKTTRSLLDLDCPRRVLLTGTPFQNNLGEFFALVDFVNPRIVGSSSEFKQIYDSPISKLQDPKCNPAQRALGEDRSSELSKLTRRFILRRTSNVLEGFLPPKIEHVVFCRPTPTQLDLARHFLQSEIVRRAFSGQASSLACIQHLGKIFNHPELLLDTASAATEAFNEDDLERDEEAEDLHEDIAEIKRFFPTGYQFGSYSVDVSSKLIVLNSLLENLGSEKIVVVSNFTKTLDVIERLCLRTRQLGTLRLDGSTENSQRQERVDLFQSDPKFRVFLLSTRAGGVGLNLFAASRLVLFDSAWNPAHDAQAQARVWRDGQVRKTFIYRLLMTGTMEEKIFQRQIAKLGLAKTVVDSGSMFSFENTRSKQFSPEELRDIFSIRGDTLCDTHDRSACACMSSAHDEDGSSKKRKLNSGGGKATLSVKEVSEWTHSGDTSVSPDSSLASVCSEFITFMFMRETTPTQKPMIVPDEEDEGEESDSADEDE